MNKEYKKNYYFKYTFKNKNFNNNKLHMNVIYLSYLNALKNKPFKIFKIKKYKV